MPGYVDQSPVRRPKVTEVEFGKSQILGVIRAREIQKDGDVKSPELKRVSSVSNEHR
ncbi:MAG TPA: hypothetical protein VFO59_06805 [Dehalococcoidia bacterium]|nr:hypothetical protein [Dehalococcoidia bacterium]